MTALLIGGGVAGLTAAIWLTRYEAPFTWVSPDGEVGGILRGVYNPIIDYPGCYAENGPAAVESLRRWADHLAPPAADTIERVRAVDSGFEVTGAAATSTYPFVLVATGTRRRLLDVPGEAEGLGQWVLTSTGATPERFRGQRVMLVGGGDAAVEGALNTLDAGAAEVVVVSRSGLHAQRQFIERFESEPRAQLWPSDASPTSFAHDGQVGQVNLDDGSTIEIDIVVVRVGVEPVRPVLDPRPRIDARGFLIVDGRGETDVPGLFAAGDVTSTPLRSIATSVGDATRAARTIAELLGIWT